MAISSPSSVLKPAMGRLIGPEDERPGNPSAAAVVSWSYWKSRFNLDRAILGKQIIVEDVPVTVVGVTPRQFHGLQVESSQDIWLPLSMEPVLHHPSALNSPAGWLSVVARLKSGVSVQQAQAEMEVLYHSTLDEQARLTNNPFLRKMKLELEPAGAGLSRLREEWGEATAAAHNCCRSAAADCVHQPCRHAAGAGGSTGARNGIAGFAWGWPLSPGPASIDRVLAVFRDRQPARGLPGILGAQAAGKYHCCAKASGTAHRAPCAS